MGKKLRKKIQNLLPGITAHHIGGKQNSLFFIPLLGKELKPLIISGTLFPFCGISGRIKIRLQKVSAVRKRAIEKGFVRENLIWVILKRH
ncbi:MAG TPA: hypothetical protein PKZ70_02055 [Candidatus Atribacteria bacterium]|nr:hypothetical protein [Candidatus Atribacteria bacterium]